MAKVVAVLGNEGFNYHKRRMGNHSDTDCPCIAIQASGK